MKNKKGFTLVELLVVIALVAAITAVAIVGINAIMDSQKKSQLESVKQEIVTAGKQYFSTNKYFLEGLKDGEVGYVSVGTLINNNYLSKVINPISKEPINNCSIVEVSSNGDYKYVDYNDKLAELQHYSKINMKSKAFINFNPLEKLSLALNFPEGYELIYARKKRVEKGEVEPAQHSLLLSENRISDVYKFSSLIANYDKTEDRRYFMSLFLKKPEEMNDLMKVAVPSITTSVSLEGENGGEVPIYREFSVEEQLEFLTRVQNEFYNLNINELLEYFKGLVGGYNKK